MSYKWLIQNTGLDVRLIKKIIRYLKCRCYDMSNKLLFAGYLESTDKLQFLIDNVNLIDMYYPEVDQEKMIYYKLCWFYTNLNDLSSLSNYENRGKGDGKYELDHKYSIYYGFINQIHPEIIGSIYNLEFIPSIENTRKREKCSIRLETLMEKYNNDIDHD